MYRKTYESLSLSHNHVAVPTHFVPQYAQSHKYEHVCHGLRCTGAAASVSRIDSVWRHTELLFDSCIVSFGVGAETPTIEAPHALQGASNAKAQRTSRQKPQSIRIYGAHLSSSRKESTKTEAREEDSLAAARHSSTNKVQQRESMARPWTSPVKLILTLVFLAALAAFWWCHRRDSDA